MSTPQEIAALEEQLRQAELGPDPGFFERILADDAILDGRRLKSRVVEAHRPGSAAKFTRVEMTDMQIIDYGDAAVVTCKGTYEGPHGTFTLSFMRVWLKRGGRWQIIAGTTASNDAST